jgi:hypothetical protein
MYCSSLLLVLNPLYEVAVHSVGAGAGAGFLLLGFDLRSENPMAKRELAVIVYVW